ncbi:MAG TPA: ABC transporter permease [Candidatus Micrarchaeia archaeon]|nr:ABC transporter permease [Candidatus Micrarchaeia archaeon]
MTAEPTLGAPPRRPAVARGRAGRGTGYLRAVFVIWYRDVIRYRRDRMRLLASLAQPLLFLLVFGVGLSSSLGGGARLAAGAAHLSYIQFMYPGVVGMAVLFTAMFSAMSIVWDREFGFLKEVLVAPIERSAIAVGKALGGATQGMLQGLIMLVFAPVVGVRLSPLRVVELLPLMFLLAFTLTTLGVVVASRMRTIQGFQVVINFLVLPLFFLSGALFPLGRLPGWMGVLTRVDPVAYGIAPLRAAALGGLVPAHAHVGALTFFGWPMPAPVSALVLLGVGVTMLALAVRGFAIRD